MLICLFILYFVGIMDCKLIFKGRGIEGVYKIGKILKFLIFFKLNNLKFIFKFYLMYRIFFIFVRKIKEKNKKR